MPPYAMPAPQPEPKPIPEPAPEPVTERPALVRMAGPADEDALYDLLLALEADNGFGIAHEEARVRAAIEKGTRRQGAMIGVIDGKKGEYGEGGELAASVCLTLAQFWYADAWFLSEQWLFVRPEYRFNHFERELFQFAKWCREEFSRQNGSNTLLVTSVSSPKRLPAKIRLWSRHAHQVGAIFQVS